MQLWGYLATASLTSQACVVIFIAENCVEVSRKESIGQNSYGTTSPTQLYVLSIFGNCVLLSTVEYVYFAFKIQHQQYNTTCSLLTKYFVVRVSTISV